MARLRIAPSTNRTTAPGQVPAELLDLASPYWRTPAAAQQWRAAHGLPATATGSRYLPRHQAAACWAAANGYLDTDGHTDWHRLGVTLPAIERVRHRSQDCRECTASQSR